MPRHAVLPGKVLARNRIGDVVKVVLTRIIATTPHATVIAMHAVNADFIKVGQQGNDHLGHERTSLHQL